MREGNEGKADFCFFLLNGRQAKSFTTDAQWKIYGGEEIRKVQNVRKESTEQLLRSGHPFDFNGLQMHNLLSAFQAGMRSSHASLQEPVKSLFLRPLRSQIWRNDVTRGTKPQTF